MLDAEAEKRFWSKVEITGFCWLWRGTRVRDGYGQFWLNGKMRSAHRISYIYFFGSIPSGLQLDHLCSVRNCINPDHLEPVTLQENTRRSPNTVLSINSNKTHCVRGHLLSGDNLYPRSDGNRECRQCKVIWNKNRIQPSTAGASKVECKICGLRIRQSSLKRHTNNIHGG